MLRTRRKLFIKWTTEGIVKGISFRVFYDAQACVSCREYVSISLRVWADHKARWHRGILLLYNRPWTLLYKYDNVQGLFYVIRKLLISYNTKNTPWGCAFRGKEINATHSAQARKSCLHTIILSLEIIWVSWHSFRKLRKFAKLS